MADYSYNYLIGKESPIPSTFSIYERPDPDTDGCIQLYKDIANAFFDENNFFATGRPDYWFNADKKYPFKSREEKIREAWDRYYALNNQNPIDKNSSQYPPSYLIKLDDPNVVLSADYFGPSVYWSICCGLTASEIREFLTIARTIGGTIAWPIYWPNSDIEYGDTINKVRGGQYGLFDRPDWTLVLLKYYFESDDFESFCKRVRQLIPQNYELLAIDEYGNNRFRDMYEAFCRARVWFDSIGNFESFCNKFKLIGSYVDSKLSIIEFAPFSALLPNNYRDYVSKLCDAMRTRTNIISNS